MPSEVLIAGLTRCEKCHRQSAQVIESKRVAEGVRRRKECRACRYRFTEYEISSAEYRRLTDAAAQLEKIKKIIDVSVEAVAEVSEPEEIPCSNCRFNTGHCSFDYPEFNTMGAIGCSLFELRLTS